MVRKASSKTSKGSKRKERRNSGVGTRRNSIGGKPRRNSIGAKPRRTSIGGSKRNSTEKKKVSLKKKATRKKINKGRKISAKKRSASKKASKRRVSSKQSKKRKRKSGPRRAGRRKRVKRAKSAPGQGKPRLQRKASSSNMGSVMFSPYNYYRNVIGESPSRSIVVPHPSLAVIKTGKLGDESAVVWANAFKVPSPRLTKSVFAASDDSGQYETSTEVSVSSIDPEELKSLNQSKSQAFKRVTPHHSLQYSFHEDAKDAKKLTKTAEAKLRREMRENTSVHNISYAKINTPSKVVGEASALDTTLHLTLGTPGSGGRLPRAAGSGRSNGAKSKGCLKKKNKITFQSLNTPKAKPGGGIGLRASMKVVDSFAVTRKRKAKTSGGKVQRIDSYF